MVVHQKSKVNLLDNLTELCALCGMLNEMCHLMTFFIRACSSTTFTNCPTIVICDASI